MRVILMLEAGFGVASGSSSLLGDTRLWGSLVRRAVGVWDWFLVSAGLICRLILARAFRSLDVDFEGDSSPESIASRDDASFILLPESSASLGYLTECVVFPCSCTNFRFLCLRGAVAVSSSCMY